MLLQNAKKYDSPLPFIILICITIYRILLLLHWGNMLYLDLMFSIYVCLVQLFHFISLILRKTASFFDKLSTFYWMTYENICMIFFPLYKMNVVIVIIVLYRPVKEVHFQKFNNSFRIYTQFYRSCKISLDWTILTFRPLYYSVVTILIYTMKSWIFLAFQPIT